MSQSIKTWLGVLAALVVALFIVLVWALLLRGPGGVTGAATASSGASESSVSSSPSPDGSKSTSEPTDSSPSPSTSPSDELSPIPEGALVLSAFALPSRNISCSMGEDGVSCQIADASFTPPAGDGCQWRGQVVLLDSGGVSMPCPEAAPAPAAEDVTVLEYGQTSSVGSWLCTSSERGIECTSRADGTGFTLARAAFTSYGPGRLM